MSLIRLAHISYYLQSTAKLLPDPFPIPIFRRGTEEALKNKKFDLDDRRYMVRVLATMLLTYVQHASMRDCEVVAKSLIRKYPFLGDFVSGKLTPVIFCSYV